MLGLTGGIGAGKSAALEAFAACGAAVLSSDAIVHGLYADPAVARAVVGRFGRGVLGPGGAVDRALLGPLIFGDPQAVAFLEGLLHPRIAAARTRWIAARRAEVPPPALLVCEVPLLFEAGLAHHFDAVVVITAPEAVRRARVEARGQDFDARAAHQSSEEDKIARADHVYVNDGDLPALREWVADLCRRIGAAEGAR